jgi:methylated-DNA-[protein]-cysteine S-methyltransferase
MEYRIYFKSPIGFLEIIADDKNILAINFKKQAKNNNSNALSKRCVVELKEYFSGTRKKFTVPIRLSGTPWQQKVWLALSQVPYGATISYVDLAAMAGKPKAARAVGGAVNKNPIPIIIPCHRVVGSSGKLVGYEGGLWRKKALLVGELS